MEGEQRGVSVSGAGGSATVTSASVAGIWSGRGRCGRRDLRAGERLCGCREIHQDQRRIIPSSTQTATGSIKINMGRIFTASYASAVSSDQRAHCRDPRCFQHNILRRVLIGQRYRGWRCDRYGTRLCVQYERESDDIRRYKGACGKWHRRVYRGAPPPCRERGLSCACLRHQQPGNELRREQVLYHIG